MAKKSKRGKSNGRVQLTMHPDAAGVDIGAEEIFVAVPPDRLVASGRPGTVTWTAAQRAELVATGRVSGFVGHHINSVNGHAEMAGNPENIKFVDGQKANLVEHGGDFRNVTEGPLMNRGAMMSRAVTAAIVIDTAVNMIGAYQVQQITGIHEGFFGGLSISDPGKAAATLNGLAIGVDANGSSPAETLSIRNGQYTDFGTGKSVDPNSLKGRSFHIVPTA
jgi:hypothetical protein